MKKAYLRSSTNRQDLSAELQLNEIVNRFGVMETVYEDKGCSGDAPIEKRPALMECLAELKKGDELFVYSFSRVARDTFLHLFIEKECQVKDVELMSVSEEDACGGGADKVLFRTIIAAVAQFEKSMIQARTKAARAALKKNGRFLGGSRPYGYRIVDMGEHKLVEKDVEEQKVIDTMKTWQIEGMSQRAITARLRDNNIKSATGGTWSLTSVNRTLKAETFLLPTQ